MPIGCLVDHTINYSLPRACFVQEMDFYAVVAADTLDDGFGKRPVSYSNQRHRYFGFYLEELLSVANY